MADVSYTRINWQDAPSTATPINQSNLNKMDKGIYDCAQQINSNNSAITQINSDLSKFKTFPARAVSAIIPDPNQFAPSTSVVVWKWCTGSNGEMYLCAYVDGTLVEAFHGFFQFESTNKYAVGHD